MTKALFIPSWYPSADAPTAGVFIQQQVRALAEVADVAVLHVDAGGHAAEPRITIENDVPVARAGVEARGPYGRMIAYTRMGLAAFEELRRRWGTPDINRRAMGFSKNAGFAGYSQSASRYFAI